MSSLDYKPSERNNTYRQQRHVESGSEGESGDDGSQVSVEPSESAGDSGRDNVVSASECIDDGGDVESDVEDAAVEPPALAPPAPAPAPAADRSIADDAFETTFDWRGFKFVRSKHKGVWNGYEVTCYHGDAAGLECRRRRNFVSHGGHDLTFRKLKAWCVAVSHPGIATALDHKGEPNDDDPPSPRTLEDIPIPELPEGEAVVRRKRRRQSV